MMNLKKNQKLASKQTGNLIRVLAVGSNIAQIVNLDKRGRLEKTTVRYVLRDSVRRRYTTV